MRQKSSYQLFDKNYCPTQDINRDTSNTDIINAHIEFLILIFMDCMSKCK